MFDLFSWSHILILLGVALVVVGPKDLPRLAQLAGRWAGKARNMAGDFRRSFDEMTRQAELDELRKNIEDLKKNNPVSNGMNVFTAVNNDLEAQVGTSESVSLAQIVSPSPVQAAGEARSDEFQVTDKASVTATKAALAPAPSGGAS